MPERDWTVDQRADWELRDMRETLEHRLGGLPADAARAVQLRAELGAVMAEQRSRGPARRAGQRAEPGQ
ncbi:MAG TPA: hypothetical protein VGG16_04925 [Streptosporangiaceae bacterium]